MTLWTVIADRTAEPDGSADRKIRLRFDEDTETGLEFVAVDATGELVLGPLSPDADANLTLTSKGAGNLIFNETVVTPEALALLDLAESASLGAISGSVSRLVAFNTSGAATSYDVTAFGLSMLDDETAADARSTLGLGSLATVSPTGTPDGTKFLRDDNVWAVPSGGGGGGSLSDGDYGDVTVSGTGTVLTIDNDVVTYAKMQNVSATDRLLGRATSGSGDVEEITCTAAGRALIDDATASDQRTTLGLGSAATQSSAAFDAAGLAATAYSAASADLSTHAGSSTTHGISAFGATLVDDANAAAARTTLGLGTLATQSGTFSGTSSGTNTGDETASTITPAARTVLDDTTVAAMVDTLGGASSTGTGGLARATSPTFVTPLLGTPTSGTLTNCTGLPVGSGISGFGAGIVTWLATPSSANLAAAMTDETGSGALVFATSPSLVTPTLGVASATSINKVAITAPATSATLTIANGATLTVSASATVSNGTHSGTNTGDQTITLTGAVTGSGTGSFATTLAAHATSHKDGGADEIATTTPASGAIPKAQSDGRIADGFMRHLEFARRRYVWQHDQGATTFSAIGTLATLSQVTVGTPAVSASEVSDGSYELQQTGVVTNDAAGRKTSATVTQRSWNPIVVAVFKTHSNITATRIWVGASDTDMNSIANPTTQNLAMLRYDTGGGVDTTGFFSFVTCDGGGTPTVTTGAVAIAASTRYVARFEFTASAVKAYVNDVLVANHTTHLPGSTVQMLLEACITTLTTNLKRLFLNFIGVVQD